MSDNPVERIFEEIRAMGYRVEAGTRGYSVHLVATDDETGRTHEVVKADMGRAAMQLLELIRQGESH